MVRAWLAFVCLASACGPSVSHEGTAPDSCRDGADNDTDGLFDCLDDGCVGSPDCRLEDGGQPRDGGLASNDAATPNVCGTRCSMPSTHWDPYSETCVVDTIIDPTYEQWVCGCDGVTYLNAAVAARRGVRDSIMGRCEPVDPPMQEPTCYGSARECVRVFDACEAQLGCVDNEGICEGTATTCDAIALEAECTTQLGCQWEVPSGEPGSCDGLPTQCDERSRTDCEGQLGCRWSEAFSECASVAVSCGGFLSSATCNAQDGCFWDPSS